MDKAAAAAVIAERGWLSRRPPAFRAALIDRCRLRQFAAGDSLYHAGDPEAGIFGLVAGELLIKAPPAESIIAVQAAGFWVGTATAFRREPRWVTLTAASPSLVLHLAQSDFEAMIADADNCRHFAIEVAESLGEAVSVVANLIQPDSEVRVAQRLLTFMGLYGEARRHALGVAQSDLAEMCGLSRQTLNKVLQGFVARGIVALQYRRLEILDAAALEAIAFDESRIWR